MAKLPRPWLPTTWPSWLPIAAWLLATLPLWGISRDFHDGVMAEWALRTQHTQGLGMWLLESNWWGHYALYSAVSWLAEATAMPAWFWIKLWMSLSVAGLGYETWRLARNYQFTPQAAHWSCVLALGFPSMVALYSSSVMHFGFAWLGLLAHRWLFWSGRWQRLAGAGLTVLAFQLNANLSLLIVLGGVAFFLAGTERRKLLLPALVWTIFSAVLFYVLSAWVYPPQGEHMNYNRILWPSSIANLLKVMAALALYLTWLPLVVIPAVIAWLAGRWFDRVSAKLPVPPASMIARHLTKQQVVIALLLTAAAAGPYILVGKGAALVLPGDARGGSLMWQMFASAGRVIPLDAFMIRQATSIAAPFALLVVSVLAFISQLSAQRSARVFQIGVVSAATILFSLLGYGHVLKWEQARWDQSIVQALRTIPAPAPGQMDIVLSPNRPYPYPVQESNHLLWMAYGRSQWFAVAYYRDNTFWQDRVTEQRAEYLVKMGLDPSTQWKHYLLMADYNRREHRCITRIALTVPRGPSSPLTLIHQLLSGSVEPAHIDKMQTQCPQTP
jgi:hypothetical protein